MSTLFAKLIKRGISNDKGVNLLRGHNHPTHVLSKYQSFKIYETR